MGKWDGKRQAARRASRPLGRLRRSQTAGFGRRPNRPAGRFQPSAQILVKGVGRVPGPARGWGRSMQGGRQNGAGPLHREKATRNGELAVCWDWDFCRRRGARRALRLRRSRRQSRRGRPADGLPFGRPGRAEIQRKYRVTSALGPADGRRLHGFAAPVRGKCGCGGWPQQNPPGVRQIQAHPRRQSAPARPR